MDPQARFPLTRRSLIASALLLGTGAAAIAMTPPRNIGITHYDLKRIVPTRIGGWHAVDGGDAVLPDPDEQATIAQAYEETVTRTYVGPGGASIMLVVAHGRPGGGLLAIHRAEVCYTAQGFTVDKKSDGAVAAPFSEVKATRLFAVRNERSEPILYWATVAGERTGVGIGQKVRLLRAAWQGRPLDAFLVRASLIRPDSPASYELLSDFLRDLLTALPPKTRLMLAGVGRA